MKKNKTNLQELATFMRDAAYSDNQTHKIDWSLSVIHPSTNDGVVGFTGGLWKKNCNSNSLEWRSIAFSYDEINGIYNFKKWNNIGEICSDFGNNPSFDEFKTVVIKFFGINQLYKVN